MAEPFEWPRVYRGEMTEPTAWGVVEEDETMPPSRDAFLGEWFPPVWSTSRLRSGLRQIERERREDEQLWEAGRDVRE